MGPPRPDSASSCSHPSRPPCIGGIALSGGKGSAWGILLGALALAVISNGVNVIGAPVFVAQFLTGALLLAALAAEMLWLFRSAHVAHEPTSGELQP